MKLQNNSINFVAGGMMGDFIQSLYAVKNICEQQGCYANIYLSDRHGGDVWKYGVEKAYNDLYALITSQSYVRRFTLMTTDFDEHFINLNDWRETVATTHSETGVYSQCWTELLSQQYKFKIPKSKKEYRWLDTDIDKNASGKILIHRSHHRHNGEFKWDEILKYINEHYPEIPIMFITTSEEEWEKFGFKNDKISLYLVSTIIELAAALNSCRYFIGNQSAPFSIASALDIPRLVELDTDPSAFYMDEKKYSDNISWFMNQEIKYSSSDAIIEL